MHGRPGFRHGGAFLPPHRPGAARAFVHAVAAMDVAVFLALASTGANVGDVQAEGAR